MLKWCSCKCGFLSSSVTVCSSCCQVPNEQVTVETPPATSEPPTQTNTTHPAASDSDYNQTGPEENPAFTAEITRWRYLIHLICVLLPQKEPSQQVFVLKPVLICVVFWKEPFWAETLSFWDPAAAWDFKSGFRTRFWLWDLMFGWKGRCHWDCSLRWANPTHRALNELPLIFKQYAS